MHSQWEEKTFTDGGIIKEGVDKTVLRRSTGVVYSWLAKQEQERNTPHR